MRKKGKVELGEKERPREVRRGGWEVRWLGK